MDPVNGVTKGYQGTAWQGISSFHLDIQTYWYKNTHRGMLWYNFEA